MPTFIPGDGGYTPPLSTQFRPSPMGLPGIVGLPDSALLTPAPALRLDGDLAAIDLSLTSSGIARIGPDGEASTTSVGMKGKRTDTLAERALRVEATAAGILNQVRGAREVLIEAPAPSRGAASGTWDRAGLWWAVVIGLSAWGVPVHSVYPGTVKKWVTGGGRAEKNTVGVHVGRLFPDVTITNDDEADALAMVHLLAYHHGYPVQTRAWMTDKLLASVKWAE